VGDSCVTYPVGKLSEQAQLLMEVTYKCMELGINEARANKRLGDVGAAIQTYAESHGFSVVRELVGHGVGRSLHEDPQVLHYGKPNTGERLRPGMVFTVEPMINVGTFETKTLPDRWTICTKDGKLSAQFEHTLAITDGAPEILTLP
jgi:methionyl aminopeptidase